MTADQSRSRPRRLLRPIEVRALLGVSRTTVHDYTAQGRLVAEPTPGGHRRYPSDQPALQEALAAQQAPR
jgi:DNA-binding transcriptional MerR regulator